jgi:DNA-binding CsgD family transcriptional regulator
METRDTRIVQQMSSILEPKTGSGSARAMPMGKHSHGGIEQVLELCTLVVGQLHTLPCVATMDWCDRAATTLVPLLLAGGGGEAAVVIMDVRGDGRVRGVLAAGVHAVRGGATQRELAIAARCRIEELKGQDWAPAHLSPKPETIAGWIHATDLTRVEPPHSAMWQLPPAGALIFASAGLGTPASLRRVMVYLAVHHVSAEQAHHDALVLQQAAGVIAGLGAVAMGKEPGTISWLTPREQQVLAHLVRGNSVKEIAEEMELSPHTVHDYVKGLHRKLRASSRGELVARAVGKGRTEALSTQPDHDAHAPSKRKS